MPSAHKSVGKRGLLIGWLNSTTHNTHPIPMTQLLNLFTRRCRERTRKSPLRRRMPWSRNKPALRNPPITPTKGLDLLPGGFVAFAFPESHSNLPPCVSPGTFRPESDRLVSYRIDLRGLNLPYRELLVLKKECAIAQPSHPLSSTCNFMG